MSMVFLAAWPDDVWSRVPGGRGAGRRGFRGGSDGRGETAIARGYLLVSAAASGAVRSIDARLTERLPGVLAVYPAPRGQPPPTDPARGGDQIVGLIVAETFEQARTAARSIAIRHSEPTAAGGAPASGEATTAGLTTRCAAVVPHAIVAGWFGQVLTVYSGSRSVGGHGRCVAAALGLDVGQVRLITPGVDDGCRGSCPGRAHACATVVVTAAAARALGRPVKTIITCEQMLTIAGSG